ncbi:hypothetical protein BH10PSE7_BH10PSE7_25800 [soil metagenome]
MAANDPLRILLIDWTRFGSGTATGQLKSSYFSGLQTGSLLHIFYGEKSNVGLAPDGDTGRAKYFEYHDRGLDAAFAAFQPEVILYRPAADRPAFHEAAMRLIRSLAVPLVTWMMDDWPERLRRSDVKAFALMDRNLRELFQRAAANFAISEKMVSEYTRRYGVSFEVFRNGVMREDWPLRDRTQSGNGVLLLRYAGGLAPDMNRDAVFDTAQAVESLAKTHEIRMEVHTQAHWFRAEEMKYKNFHHVSFDTATLDESAYRGWLLEADISLIAYNFDEASVRYAQYSFANKTPECLASGAAVLAYGPRQIATIDYLARCGAVAVVDARDPANLSATIEDLITNPARRAVLAEAGRRLAFERFDLDRQRHDFMRKLFAIARKPAAAHYIERERSNPDLAINSPPVTLVEGMRDMQDAVPGRSAKTPAIAETLLSSTPEDLQLASPPQSQSSAQARPQAIAIVAGEQASGVISRNAGGDGIVTFAVTSGSQTWSGGPHPAYIACLEPDLGESEVTGIADLVSRADTLGIRGFLFGRDLIHRIAPIVGIAAPMARITDSDSELRDSYPHIPFDAGALTALWARQMGFRRIVLLGIACEPIGAGGDTLGPDVLRSWTAVSYLLRAMGTTVLNATHQSRLREFDFCDIEDVFAQRPIRKISRATLHGEGDAGITLLPKEAEMEPAHLAPPGAGIGWAALMALAASAVGTGAAIGLAVNNQFPWAFAAIGLAGLAGALLIAMAMRRQNARIHAALEGERALRAGTERRREDSHQAVLARVQAQADRLAEAARETMRLRAQLFVAAKDAQDWQHNTLVALGQVQADIAKGRSEAREELAQHKHQAAAALAGGLAELHRTVVSRNEFSQYKGQATAALAGGLNELRQSAVLLDEFVRYRDRAAAALAGGLGELRRSVVSLDEFARYQDETAAALAEGLAGFDRDAVSRDEFVAYRDQTANDLVDLLAVIKEETAGLEHLESIRAQLRRHTARFADLDAMRAQIDMQGERLAGLDAIQSDVERLNEDLIGLFQRQEDHGSSLASLAGALEDMRGEAQANAASALAEVNLHGERTAALITRVEDLQMRLADELSGHDRQLADLTLASAGTRKAQEESEQKWQEFFARLETVSAALPRIGDLRNRSEAHAATLDTLSAAIDQGKQVAAELSNRIGVGEEAALLKLSAMAETLATIEPASRLAIEDVERVKKWMEDVRWSLEEERQRKNASLEALRADLSIFRDGLLREMRRQDDEVTALRSQLFLPLISQSP